MGYDYDTLYRDQPDALGAPTPALADFLQSALTAPARVLDIGCGQGRDALFLARNGHAVVGVDLSAHGIADMLAAANREQLEVAGHVADITGFTPEGTFDVLLFDRTLHMLGRAARHGVLARLLPCLRPTGLLAIVDEPGNMAGFRDVLNGSGVAWERLVDRRGQLYARRGALTQP